MTEATAKEEEDKKIAEVIKRTLQRAYEDIRAKVRSHEILPGDDDWKAKVISLVKSGLLEANEQALSELLLVQPPPSSSHKEQVISELNLDARLPYNSHRNSVPDSREERVESRLSDAESLYNSRSSNSTSSDSCEDSEDSEDRVELRWSDAEPLHEQNDANVNISMDALGMGKGIVEMAVLRDGEGITKAKEAKGKAKPSLVSFPGRSHGDALCGSSKESSIKERSAAQAVSRYNEADPARFDWEVAEKGGERVEEVVVDEGVSNGQEENKDCSKSIRRGKNKDRAGEDEQKLHSGKGVTKIRNNSSSGRSSPRGKCAVDAAPPTEAADDGGNFVGVEQDRVDFKHAASPHLSFRKKKAIRGRMNGLKSMVHMRGKEEKNLQKGAGVVQDLFRIHKMKQDQREKKHVVLDDLLGKVRQERRTSKENKQEEARKGHTGVSYFTSAVPRGKGGRDSTGWNGTEEGGGEGSTKTF